MYHLTMIKETNTKKYDTSTFDKNNLLATPWGIDRLKTETFKSLKQCTIELEMRLMDVYNDGVNVTNNYLSINN